MSVSTWLLTESSTAKGSQQKMMNSCGETLENLSHVCDLTILERIVWVSVCCNEASSAPLTSGTRTTCTQVSVPSHVSNIPSGVPGGIRPPKDRTSSCSDQVLRISRPRQQSAIAISSARKLNGSEFKLWDLWVPWVPWVPWPLMPLPVWLWLRLRKAFGLWLWQIAVPDAGDTNVAAISSFPKISIVAKAATQWGTWHAAGTAGASHASAISIHHGRHSCALSTRTTVSTRCHGLQSKSEVLQSRLHWQTRLSHELGPMPGCEQAATSASWTYMSSIKLAQAQPYLDTTKRHRWINGGLNPYRQVANVNRTAEKFWESSKEKLRQNQGQQLQQHCWTCLRSIESAWKAQWCKICKMLHLAFKLLYPLYLTICEYHTCVYMCDNLHASGSFQQYHGSSICIVSWPLHRVIRP